MGKVRALTKGYVDGILREPGEVFEWPKGVPVGKWTAPVAFGGKGDHDGDGRTGGSRPKQADAVSVPADWESQSAAERRALAREISGSAVPNAAEADRIISEYLDETPAEVFGDAPEPETVKGNGVKEALGTEPDWVAPSSDGKPVMSED